MAGYGNSGRKSFFSANTPRKPADPIRVLNKMRWLCSKREYCTYDIRKKVVASLSVGRTDEDSRAEIPGMAEGIMSSLIADKYVDDARYATAFVRDRANIAGWGERKIRYALLAKKIDESIVVSALKEISDEKASENLEKIIASKLRSLPKVSLCPPSEKWKLYQLNRQKLLRLAVSRGYSFDEALAVIDRQMKEE